MRAPSERLAFRRSHRARFLYCGLPLRRRGPWRWKWFQPRRPFPGFCLPAPKNTGTLPLPLNAQARVFHRGTAHVREVGYPRLLRAIFHMAIKA